MSGVTGAIIGAGVLGAGASIYGSNKAADAQAQGSANAINAQEQLFNVSNSEAAPTRALGYGADSLLAQLFGINGVNSAIAGTNPANPSAAGASTAGGTPSVLGTPATTSPNYSGFENNPGFKFALNLGNQGIQRQAAANGSLYSPGTATQESQYTTGFASQNYNNYVNSLLTAAGLGNTSQQSTGNNATQAGQGISNSYTNIGQANASGVASSTGAITGLLTNNNFLNALKGSAGNPAGSTGFAPYTPAPE